MSTTEQQDEIAKRIAALRAEADALTHKQFAHEHLAGETNAEKDEGLLRVIGITMERRLAEAREKGRAGWWGDDVTDAQLLERLQQQIATGQYVDAAIYAAMLHVRHQLA
jgi:hypothetical protein